MKSPDSYAPPRQLATKKPVRLDLRRATSLSPEDELMEQRKSTFWKWFGFVALLHLVAICIFGWLHETSPTPPPKFEFSLLSEGEVSKGTPGAQQAPKVGLVTPAPSIHPVRPPDPTPPIKPQPIQPAQAAVIPPPPVPTPKPVTVIKPDAPLVAKDKPVTPPKPKVKINLGPLVDGPAPANAKPIPKHTSPKKTVVAATDDASNQNSAVNSESHGLSKEEVAQQLGKKLGDAGVKDALKIGKSGAPNSKANSFADFYTMIRDQVMDKWQHPNQVNDEAIDPVVQIHVEKDGRVPPESVTLIKSSGNPSYDDSALTAAKSLGYLLQPLPDGCLPDIPITFKLTR